MASSRPEPLSAKDGPGTFAYDTVSSRMPVILTRVIDATSKLASKLTETSDHNRADDVKTIVNKLSGLKYELQTDKCLVALDDSGVDNEIWNKAIKETSPLVPDKELSFFSGAWLFVECYMYRRIYQAFATSKLHKDYDPFDDQKRESFFSTLAAVKSLSENVIKCTEMLGKCASDEAVRLEFETLLQFCLWGNKCDLSVSGGVIQEDAHTGTAAQLEHLKAMILVDHTSEVWQLLQKIDRNSDHEEHIDFVLDNAGFEVFTDLCLAEFLLSMNLAKTIHFHVKDMPWFVSDASEKDTRWLVGEMENVDNPYVTKLACKWQQRFKEESFRFKHHMYWTLPHDYSAMKATSPGLYANLSEAKLVFFKGDLNYRKLVGDRKWPHTTLFSEALWGFCPAPVCSLRTLKADVVVGLKEGQDSSAQAKDEKWMVNGTYAVIQYQQHL